MQTSWRGLGSLTGATPTGLSQFSPPVTEISLGRLAPLAVCGTPAWSPNCAGDMRRLVRGLPPTYEPSKWGVAELVLRQAGIIRSVLSMRRKTTQIRRDLA